MHTPKIHDVAKLQGRIRADIYRDGTLLSTHFTENLVVSVGRQHALDCMFGKTTAAGTWYCAPLGSGTPADSWDMTTIGASGYEFTTIKEPARQAWTSVRTVTTISNTASKAKYTIDGADRTITGAFLADEGTLGGSLGTLVAAGNFTSPRTGLQDGDEVYLTYEISSTT